MILPESIKTAVERGAQRLNADGTKFVLVGTAALWHHNLKGIEAPSDVDFLCERIDGSLIDLKITQPTGGQQYGVHEEIEGIKVDYILADNGRGKFLSAKPDFSLASDIPVAQIADVLGLKWWANRPKDLAFFAKLRESPCFTGQQKGWCAPFCENWVALHEFLARNEKAIDAFLVQEQKVAEALLNA